MNQTFQFRRLSLLLRLYFEENGRWYLTKLAIYWGISGAFLSTLKSTESYQIWFFLFSVMIIGMNGADATTNLANYNEKNEKGMRYLLLPTSSAEKVIASLTINSCFCLLNIAFVILMKRSMTYFPQNFIGFGIGSVNYYESIIYYVLVISILFIGSIFFSKLSLIKSLIILLIFYKIPNLYQSICNAVLNNTSYRINYHFFHSWEITELLSKEEHYVETNNLVELRVCDVYLIDSYPELLQTTYIIVLIGATWYASFLRLRETEI